MSNTVHNVVFNVKTHAINDGSVKQATKEVDGLKTKIEDLKLPNLGNNKGGGLGGGAQKSFDIMGKSVDGLKTKMSGLVGGIPIVGESLLEMGTAAGPIGLALAATAAAMVGIGVHLVGIRREIDKTKDSFRGFEKNNKVLEDLAIHTKAIQTTFEGIDTVEYAKAVKGMGIAFNTTSIEASNLVDKVMLLTNGMADLDNMVEYAPMMAQMKMTGEQYVALTAKANEFGIYNDKAQDATKEFHLSINNLTADQTKGLNKYGIDFQALQAKVKSGRMSEIDALKELSKQSSKLNTQQKTDVLSTIFKAPGEDATIAYFDVINAVDDKMAEMVANMDSKTRIRYETNLKMATAQSKATVPFENLMSNISTIWDNIVIKAYEFITPVVEAVSAIGDLLIELAPLVSFLFNLVKPILFLAEVFLDSITLVIQLATKALQFIFEIFDVLFNSLGKLISLAGDFALSLLPDWLKDGFSNFWNGFIDGIVIAFDRATALFDMIYSYMQGINSFLTDDKKTSDSKFKKANDLKDFISGKTNIDPRIQEDLKLGKKTVSENKTLEKNLETKISKSTEASVSASISNSTNINISLEALQKFAGNQIVGAESDSQRILEGLNIGFMQILNNTNQLANK